jgi:hypothetical protein
VTSISPVHVGTAGGSLVTVRGDALESGLGVRVGPSGVAHVVRSSAAGLTFLTPALVAGTYDVTVYKAGRTSVLTDALVYSAAGTVDPGTGGGEQPGSTDPVGPTPVPVVPAPGGSGSDPGDEPSDGGSSTPAPAPGGSVPTPGAGSPTPGSGGSTPGTGGGDGGASTPTSPGATRVGPNGERLVRNDALASLSGLWSTTCATTCTGRQV